MPRRPVLSQDRIVEAAVGVADRGGLAAVSMRSVAAALGVEAMSLYHHVAGKDALLDALADWVVARIRLPDPAQPWRPAMVDRAASAREVLAAHAWALGLIESRRTPLPNLLRHHEAVLACLRGNGFPVELAAHAMSALDAYVYGFVLTESQLPMEPGESVEAFVDTIRDALPEERYPFMVELIRSQVEGADYAYGNEFEFGLDLILDSLEQRLAVPSDRG